MTENIKRLFEQMDRSTKQQALACLKKEFDVLYPIGSIFSHFYPSYNVANLN